LKIELMMPEASELKAGFLPIPSLSWIKLEKYDFKNIGPDQSAQTDVIITIPSSTQYQNKKYQVYIWTHTVEGAIRIGLKSRLLLVIKGGNRALR
ncbi:MAG: hypothetical protein NTY47_05195, partial [Candidatus Omnitrophica bacterium]|nr:hypothetical protein [Candidatus Omnitrophota bacterium]